MAYQKVGGTPRFYIDQIQYLKSLNFDFEKWYEDNGYNANTVQAVYSKTILDTPELFNLDPVNQTRYTFTDTGLVNGSVIWDIPTGYSPNLTFDGDNLGRYFAILNHNMATENNNDLYTNFSWRRYGNSYSGYGVTESGILNNETYQTPFDGCTIVDIDRTNSNYNPPHEDANFFTLAISGYDYQVEDDIIKEINIGALSTGIYYDMPVSPDLDLSMSIEFDGVNNIKTLNGSTITQANYQGSPWWYDVDGNKVEPWSVGESTGLSKRNGRRVWKLKFSYMSDKDLFASNYGSNDYLETDTGYDGGDLEVNWGQNIVLTPDFDTDTNWTKGSGWSINTDDNVAVCTAGGGGSISQGAAEIGKTYKLVIDIKDVDPGTFRPEFGGIRNHVYGDGIYEKIITATTTEGLSITPFNIETEGEVNSIYVYPAISPTFYYNIDNDDSFSAQVLSKISHGEKFIFQPDNTANNPSDFAICVLDGDSFDMKRVAPNVYDIEMKIREVW